MDKMVKTASDGQGILITRSTVTLGNYGKSPGHTTGAFLRGVVIAKMHYPDLSRLYQFDGVG